MWPLGLVCISHAVLVLQVGDPSSHVHACWMVVVIVAQRHGSCKGRRHMMMFVMVHRRPKQA